MKKNRVKDTQTDRKSKKTVHNFWSFWKWVRSSTYIHRIGKCVLVSRSDLLTFQSRNPFLTRLIFVSADRSPSLSFSPTEQKTSAVCSCFTAKNRFLHIKTFLPNVRQFRPWTVRPAVYAIHSYRHSKFFAPSKTSWTVENRISSVPAQ